MKQINVTMDANGHIDQGVNGGVMGDHHAAELCITLADAPAQAMYYRLYFAGRNDTLISEQLQPADGAIRYTLPDRVTRLGTSVLCQLCAYAGTDDSLTLVFKSDPFPLALATSLPDTSDPSNLPLTNQLEELLGQVQTIAETFDVTVGTVETLAFDQAATATLTRDEDMHYTLDLAIPQGEKGEGSFTAGSGISIVNGEISVTLNQVIYDASENTYEYISIVEPRKISDLAGTVFFVNPRYQNASDRSYICTTGEGAYYALYRYDGATLTDTFPTNAIVPGRPMIVYVNQSGVPIYLNPNLPQAVGSPCVTVTPSYDNTGMPSLQFDGISNSFFFGGKTVIATATADIIFNGTNWYGPLNSLVKVYYDGNWSNTSHLVDKTIPAGQPLLMYVEYDASNYTFPMVKLLNPPA